jgi:taurine transport system permease protein
MGDGRSAAFRLAVGAATFAVLALLWYGATSITHAIPPVYFPTPAEVAQALQQITIRGYADGKLHEHFLHSSLLVLMGFAAAVAIGIPLGMLMGWSRRAEALINPVFCCCGQSRHWHGFRSRSCGSGWAMPPRYW